VMNRLVDFGVHGSRNSHCAGQDAPDDSVVLMTELCVSAK